MGKYTSKLQDKKVLVIGGTSGVGFAVAEAVLEYGGIAIISSSQQSKISSAIQRLQSSYPEAATRVTGLPCDLSDSSNLDDNLKTLLSSAASFNPSQTQPFSSHISIHHIVFTAGNSVLPMPPLLAASLQTLSLLSSVRYTAAVFLAKHAPAYLAPGPESSITLTTNVSEYKPLKGWALSTGATSLNGLVTGLAADLAPVRVNCVKLGFVATERFRDVARAGLEAGRKGESGGKEITEDEVKSRFEKLKVDGAEKTLTGKVGSAEMVCEAYLYLIKDENVTGQSVVTDGGRTLV